MGANLAGQDSRPSGTDVGDGEGSPSEVSTVNSVKSSKTVDSFAINKLRQNYREQVGNLKTENLRFVASIITTQSCFEDDLNILD